MKREYAEYLVEKTKQDYNLIAEDFSRTRNLIWPEISSLLDKYFSFGGNVLDLGCGNGRYFEYFKGKRVNYFGVDRSEELIKSAKSMHTEANFQAASVFNLPFPDNFFDGIISIAVFHQIPSEEFRIIFLKEAKRVLKPGGVLFLTVWNFRKSKEFFLFSKSIILKLLGLSRLDFGDFLEPWADKTKRYYHCFTQKELINLAQKTDFNIKDIGIIKNERGNRRNIYMAIEK